MLQRLPAKQGLRALETQVRFEVLGYFTDKTLERQLADQQIGTFLVFADFAKCNSTRAITVRFLYTAGGWCRFTGCLGCKSVHIQ